MKAILHSVDIQASQEIVYQALSTEKGLAGWWSTRVIADMRLGGTIDFRFIENFNPSMQITALEEPRVVEWACVGGHDPWSRNTFRFSVEPRGDGSILLFRQVYAKELNDEEYGRYNFNWGYYLHSLKLLCETGIGKPFGESDDDKKAVVERFVEEYKNRQNPGIVDELISEDCRVHIPLPGLPQGREGMRLNGQLMCGAFPDVHVEREFFLADRDIVVERANAVATHKGELMNATPTGRRVTWSELHAYRVRDGMINEVWSEADFMGVMAQIGAVRLPGSGND